MNPRLSLALLTLLTLMLLPPASANADGNWIDGPRVNWNQAGMKIPTAQPMAPDVEPRCLDLRRRPQTFEDKQAAPAGWSLWGSYQAGWGMVSVKVLSGFDSACRPRGFQELVFVDGAFAGTISPVLME